MSLGMTKAVKGGSRVEHRIRTKDEGFVTLKMGRRLAIQLMCTECLGWEDHPDSCTSPLCPVFPFRGKTMKSQKGDGRDRAG